MDASLADRDRLHARAADRAEHRDAKWFARHPFAYLRLRETLPFEKPEWDAEGHESLPFVLVEMPEDRDPRGLTRKYFYADECPDRDPASLAALSVMIADIEDRVAEGGSRFATAADVDRAKYARAAILQRAPRVQFLNAPISTLRLKEMPHG